MSLWHCDTHGLTGPTPCCSQGRRATLEKADVPSGALPNGEFKQNARGFYHFYAAPGQGLSAHDCRRVAAWLKAHNAAGGRSQSAKACES